MSGDLEDFMRELDEQRHNTGLAGAHYWMSYAYHRVRDKVCNAPRQVKWAYQRVTRGWDDRAVWSLDAHLARTLGQQLVRMGEIAYGHPEGYPHERWTADLKTHGQALTLYSEGWVDRWESTGQPAQQAVRWVADNLAALWD